VAHRPEAKTKKEKQGTSEKVVRKNECNSGQSSPEIYQKLMHLIGEAVWRRKWLFC
jgi:hypothetical protein